MSELRDQKMQIWKTIVEVQQHFNEIEMRIRNVAVTVLGAFLAAGGYTLKEGLHVVMWGQTFSLTGLVLLAAILCWLCFYFMDRFWYHQLLVGAVKQGRTVEKSLEDELPEISLTKAIGDASPIRIGKVEIHSATKIDIFYLVIAGILAAAAIVAFVQRVPATPPRAAPPVTTSNPIAIVPKRLAPSPPAPPVHQNKIPGAAGGKEPTPKSK